MDRWLSGQEEACSVVSQHPMMAYNCKSNFEGSNIPAFLSGHFSHIIYRHTCKQNAHTHNFFIKKLNTFIWGKQGRVLAFLIKDPVLFPSTLFEAYLSATPVSEYPIMMSLSSGQPACTWCTKIQVDKTLIYIEQSRKQF